MRAGPRLGGRSRTATSRSSSSTRSGSASSTASTAAATPPPTCSPSRSTRSGPAAGPRELGDVVICPEETEDLREAVVHGVLHLAGMDHETDDGEMLALQREILAWRRELPTARAAASSPWPGGRTPASRRSSTRSWGRRSRSSPTSRRPPAARSAAWPPGPDWQLVLVDLPGRPAPARRAHRAHAAPRGARARRGRRRAGRPQRRAGGRRARATASSRRAVGPRRCPSSLAVNKIDRLRQRAHRWRRSAPRPTLLPEAEVFPISARRGTGRRRRSSSTSSRCCPRGRPTSRPRTDLRPARARCCWPS